MWFRVKTTGTTLFNRKVRVTTVGIFPLVNGKSIEGWTVPKVTGEVYKNLLWQSHT
jgi:hypothetical protein